MPHRLPECYSQGSDYYRCGDCRVPFVSIPPGMSLICLGRLSSLKAVPEGRAESAQRNHYQQLSMLVCLFQSFCTVLFCCAGALVIDCHKQGAPMSPASLENVEDYQPELCRLKTNDIRKLQAIFTPRLCII